MIEVRNLDLHKERKNIKEEISEGVQPAVSAMSHRANRAKAKPQARNETLRFWDQSAPA